MSGQKEKFEQHVRKMENAEMENKKEGGQQGVSKFYIDSQMLSWRILRQSVSTEIQWQQVLVA